MAAKSSKAKALSLVADALKMMHGEPLETGEVLVYLFEYPQCIRRINKILAPLGVRLRVRSCRDDDGLMVRAEVIAKG